MRHRTRLRLNGQHFLDIGEGEIVAVFGSGFIGCLHAELALAKGAATVIMVDVDPVRLELSRRLTPGLRTINSSAEPLAPAVRDITGGEGADVAIVACSPARRSATPSRSWLRAAASACSAASRARPAGLSTAT